MTVFCRRCQQPKQDRLYFASYLEREAKSRMGFLCGACHDALEAQGRIIGYVPTQGDGARWVAQLFALRTLHDQFPEPNFQYERIRRIQREIPVPPVRSTLELLDRVADAYCRLATEHGGLRTCEGWLFGTAGRQLKLMLESENPAVRGAAHRERYRSILSWHDAVVEAAARGLRRDVIKNLVGLVAATYSARFKPSANVRDGALARDFLTALAVRAPRMLGAYDAWEAVRTGDPWVVFVASRIGYIRRTTVRRVCELLLQAAQRRSPYRYEVLLRALHWDVLVQRCLEMTSLSEPT